MHISRHRQLEALVIAVTLSAFALTALLTDNGIQSSPTDSMHVGNSPYTIMPIEEADHLVGDKTFVSMNVEARQNAIGIASDSPGGFIISIHKAGGLSEDDLELGTLGQFVYPTIPYERVDAETLVVYCDGLLPSGQDHGSVYLSGRLLTNGVYTFSFSVVDGAHNTVSDKMSSNVSA